MFEILSSDNFSSEIVPRWMSHDTINDRKQGDVKLKLIDESLLGIWFE